MNRSDIIRAILFSVLLLNIGLFIYLSSNISPESCNDYAKDSLTPARIMRMEKVKEPRLTDVVIPMPPKHFTRVVSLLKMWNDYPPCYNPTPSQLSTEEIEENDFYKAHDYNLGHSIVLTFYVSSPSDNKLEAKLMTAYNELNPEVKQCFSKARVHFAGLTGDNDGYWKGTTLMFEYLLNNKVGLRWPHYVFYMEPDMLPLQKYWLSVLDASTRKPASAFWMKGSIFKGHPFIRSASIISLSCHINGNAIYNLADPRFREFYFRKVYSMSRSDYKNNHAYDLDIFFYLTNPDNFEWVKYIAHKFQYTELIQNLYHTEYSAKDVIKHYPNAYLIHGGTRKP